MNYKSDYISPLGKIHLSCNDTGLTGLYFEGQKYFDINDWVDYKEAETEIILDTKRWLDKYFSGIEPKFFPPISLNGTNFQLSVWAILREIPYGKTVTYAQTAKETAEKRGLKKMSAQAIGGAVGRNKISIIIPCHRVISTNGELTGYAGGLERKKKLLLLECADGVKY